MMVGSEFPGDNNKTLMDVQHTAYGEMVVRLFTGPRDRYLAAAALLCQSRFKTPAVSPVL